MGVMVLPEGNDNNQGSKKSAELSGIREQTDIPHSEKACTTLVDELKADSPSGKPLLSLIQPGAETDLSKYGFKQPNEFLRPGEDPDEVTPVDSMRIGDMRRGVYGQRPDGEPEVSTPEQSKIIERPEYFKDMQDVFGNSRYYDLVRNHNAVISAPEGQQPGEHIHRPSEGAIDDLTATVSGKSKEATTLINFDAHSDLWVNDPNQKINGQESIAQWVNAVLEKNPNINEVYWVLPDAFKANPDVRAKYFDFKGPLPDYDSVLVHAKPDLDLYLDKESGKIFTGEKPKDYSEDKYRTVKFHKRTMDELPNMEGKRVAASIDLDYFDNRGYDTTYKAQAEYKGEEGFARFVAALKEKGIKPVHTTMSASPEYVRSEHARDLLRFAANVSDSTIPKLDAVAVPREDNVYASGGHTGIQVNREGSKGLTLMDGLFKNDARTVRPDDRIDLSKDSDELRAGIEATRRIYGVDEKGARDILARLDRMDGKEDNVVQFESIEMLLNRVCRSSHDDLLRKDPISRRSG
ncbi:MAG: hypothetical protein AB7V06_06565 [Candidatus Obscuribacterales bacterium]